MARPKTHADRLVARAFEGVEHSHGKKWRSLLADEVAMDLVMGRVALAVAGVEQTGSVDYPALLDECWRLIRDRVEGPE